MLRPTQEEALDSSSKIIDTTRSPEYTKHGLQFSQAFAAAQGVDLALFGAQAETVGIKLAVINHLFENATSVDEAESIFGSIKEALDVEACEVVLGMVPQDEIGALKTRIAFITSSGYKRLSEMDAALADRWLLAWQNSIERICYEEGRKTYFRLGDKPSDFFQQQVISGSVNLFLEEFSRTGASEVALIGNFPFISEPSIELLELYSEFSNLTSPWFRFAQDVVVNPGEKVNTGLFALALAKSISIDEARESLAPRKTRRDFQQNLVTLWEIYDAEQRVKIVKFAAESSHPEHFQSMMNLLSGIVTQLSSNWQKID